MSLFDVSIFSVKKENYLITVYNNSHPFPGSIWEDASLDKNYKSVSYGLDYTIINYYEF